MNSLDGIDYDEIKKAILRCSVSGPYTEVVDREAEVPLHLIHFHPEHYGQSPLLYAHRNGNGCMFVRLKAGGYRMCRFWKDPEEVNRYPTRFEREDVDEFFHMVTANDVETLQYLPKLASPSSRSRVVIYRENQLGSRWIRGSDKFTLSYAGDGPLVTSPEFEGKVWESPEAVAWCEKVVPSRRADLELGRINLEAATVIAGELEDHPLAFMF